MKGDVLFNCCTGFQEPDWALFDALEMSGSKTEVLDNADEYTIGGIERNKAQFFTVYGHLKTGGVDAITDVPAYTPALAILALLSARTGLPHHVYC